MRRGWRIPWLIPQSRQSTRLFLQSLWVPGGGTHSLAGEWVGSLSSNEGTDTVVLYVYMHFVAYTVCIKYIISYVLGGHKEMSFI